VPFTQVNGTLPELTPGLFQMFIRFTIS
jgi:hypothetical protein